LRVEPRIEQIVPRSTVQKTYDLILADLLEAKDLLPPTAVTKNRPIRAAAYGALARVYLSMEDYSNALLYADQYLQLSKTLIDYNTLPLVAPALGNIFPQSIDFNPEVIFRSVMNNHSALSQSNAIIDSLLYLSYNTNDL